MAGDIRRQSDVDEARPADVILVLGAAEYRGRPSPILEARLNHALFLYRQEMAPRIMTTGGKGGDPMFTEGEVGRAYLSRHGIPSEAIIVESEGETTVHSTAAAAEIMRRMNLHSCIVVSDGYHIYRVKTDAAIPGNCRVRIAAAHRASPRLAAGVDLFEAGHRFRLVARRNSGVKLLVAAGSQQDLCNHANEFSPRRPVQPHASAWGYFGSQYNPMRQRLCENGHSVHSLQPAFSRLVVLKTKAAQRAAAG